MELTEKEQKFLNDVREKNPELLEDVEAALESREGGFILDGNEIVGFSFWPGQFASPRSALHPPVVEAVVVDDGSR